MSDQPGNGPGDPGGSLSSSHSQTTTKNKSTEINSKNVTENVTKVENEFVLNKSAAKNAPLFTPKSQIKCS